MCGFGGETAKWPNAAEGETVAAFSCLFGMSDPPQMVAMGFRVPNACSNPSSQCALTPALTSYRGSYRTLTGCSNELSGGVIAF